MIKTSKATPSQINYLVAKIEGMNVKLEQVYGLWSVMTDNYKFYEPAIDWAQGGPIIEREKIDIAVSESGEEWNAQYRFKKIRDDEYWSGPTSLIAAMRCFLVKELGDTADVPQELINV